MCARTCVSTIVCMNIDVSIPQSMREGPWTSSGVALSLLRGLKKKRVSVILPLYTSG